MNAGFARCVRRFLYTLTLSICAAGLFAADGHGATSSSSGGTQSASSHSSTTSAGSASTSADAFIRSMDGKPAWLLLSHASNAKEIGRYDQAILYLRSALSTRYGREEFQEGLKHALEHANEELEHEAHRYLTPYLKSDGHSSAPEILIYFYLRDAKLDEATGLTRAALEMRTYTDIVPPEKLWNYFLGRASDLFKTEMTKQFPKNPLRYFEISGRRFVEGYFNSEYPEVIPEVNFELGMLYRDTQDYILAERYLKNAIDAGQYFSISEKTYAAKYALTDMYRIRGQSFAYQYETMLKSVVAEESAWSAATGPEQKQREQIRKLFMDDPQSLDRVLKLFRLQDGYSREAHRQLGLYYLQRRNYEEALPHLLFNVVQVFSKVTEEVRKLNYGYEFTSLSALLAEARTNPDLVEYLKSSKAYDSLFALSEAALGYRPNFTRPSRAIWTVLATYPESGEYGERSRVLLSRR